MESGYGSLEEHMQGYLESFLWLQQEQEPELFEKRRRLLEEREEKTEIFLPAVCLRECCSLTPVEYWIMMFAFCCETEGRLCMDYRNRYQESRPGLQYILHLLSAVMPVSFSDVAELCKETGALRKFLFPWSDEEETERKGFLQHPLLLNPAVLHFLLTGGFAREDWYSFSAAGEEEFLPLHEEEYIRLCHCLAGKEPVCVLLYGSRGSGSHTLMRRVCGTVGLNSMVLGTKCLLRTSGFRRACCLQVLRLICVLFNPVVILELADECSASYADQWEEMRLQLFRDLRESHLCILAQTQAQADLMREYTDVRISLREELSPEEKRTVLDTWVAEEDRRQWQEELLEDYRMHIGELEKCLKRIHMQAQADECPLTHREAWLEALQEKQENFRFGRLVEDRFAPEEIILPGDCQRQLDTVIRLAKAWRGKKGLQLLFHGSSGTGKTMAAAVLAGQLQLPLLKVDLSQVFDKYIGETEKHIDEIFRTARRNHYLLFFDEADALFAKRTAVRDSHDRYANVSAAFLLQRMEEYEGILILATNLRDHFDDAFVRRIRFAVKFRNLDREGRERLWRKVLEGDRPTARDVDFGALAAAAELSPARISAAAYVAKLLAEGDGSGIITKEHLREALALETGKDETTLKGF